MQFTDPSRYVPPPTSGQHVDLLGLHLDFISILFHEGPDQWVAVAFYGLAAALLAARLAVAPRNRRGQRRDWAGRTVGVLLAPLIPAWIGMFLWAYDHWAGALAFALALAAFAAPRRLA
jgi:hypothetical protein